MSRSVRIGVLAVFTVGTLALVTWVAFFAEQTAPSATAPTEIAAPDGPAVDPIPARPQPIELLGPGKSPEPLADYEIDAAIPTDTPAMNFWEQGKAACVPGGRLEGGLPPKDTVIRCVDELGRWTGPDAVFHPGEPARLMLIGRREESKMVGVWQWFHPSGAKAAEHTYVDGQLHGTMRKFAENGVELEYGEYRAGRPWGLFVSRDEQGTELARVQLDAGTGVLKQATSSGRSESDYVHGLLHGKHREFDASGRVIVESHWAGGEMHGLETRYDAEGRKWVENSYAWGQLDGPATRWKDGVIVERSIWVTGTERSRQLYRDEQPLAELPPPRQCDSDIGLAQAFDLDSEDGCIARSPLFPGILMIGSFAHDRGCMSARWVVDCELAPEPPSAADVLARAGWAKATPEQRTLLAKEYVRELGLAWSGSITSDPEEPVWTVREDGSIEGVVWVAEPSGMQRGRVIDKIQFGFSPAGVLSQTALEHRSTLE